MPILSDMPNSFSVLLFFPFDDRFVKGDWYEAEEVENDGFSVGRPSVKICPCGVTPEPQRSSVNHLIRC